MGVWNGVVFLTEHAIRRSQERGIRKDVVELTARHGKSIRAKKGAMKRYCPGSTIRHLESNGLSRQIAERLDGISVITMDDASRRKVITVEPRRQKRH